MEICEIGNGEMGDEYACYLRQVGILTSFQMHDIIHHVSTSWRRARTSGLLNVRGHESAGITKVPRLS